MRKFFLIIILIIVGAAFLNLKLTLKSGSKLPPAASENISPTLSAEPDISTQGGYKIVWLTVKDTEKLFLYSNLLDLIPAKDFATKNSCVHLISGGFYDTDRKHIGLLISEGQILSQSQENDTFKGYFSVSTKGLASITEYPVFSPRISLQSGPILLKKGSKTDLVSQNIENARRLAVGITQDNEVVFLAIYDQFTPLLGPTLEELPGILEKFSKDRNLNLNYVLNLDGGAHSAFISDLATLTEVSPVGSFFCLKP